MHKLVKCELKKIKRKHFISFVLFASVLFPVVGTAFALKGSFANMDNFSGLFAMIISYGIALMLPCVLGIVASMLFIIERDSAAFLLTKGNDDYYAQIDNRWVTEIAPRGNMHYKYTLDAYDEKGSKKSITFETGKKLAEDAFLCLKVEPIRGVVSWAEVQYDELPGDVQKAYEKQ